MARCHKLLLLLTTSLLTLTASETNFSCSRILHADKNQSVMVARSMDWSEEMNTNLFVYPAGVFHQGGNEVNPLRWISHYGSMVTTVYSNITTDGLNEKGLSVQVLELNESDYGKRNSNLPALPVTDWAQFYLDNFATVDDAIRYTESNSFQVTPVFLPETHEYVKLHFAIADAKGDSAIIEYINGKAFIYHDRSYIVLTNSPTYAKQLENLRDYEGLGGTKPLPGTSDAKDRFVRAAYYTLRLSNTQSSDEELSDILGVIRNVSQPKLAPTTNDDAWTLWRTVSDLTHGIYYFEDTLKTALIWAKLSDFNLAYGARVMKFDLKKHPSAVGDVSKEFEVV